MANTIIEPCISIVYNEIDKGKYLTTRYYESNNAVKPFNLVIKIAVDRGYAKSNPDYWLTNKEGVKLAKNALSGLFKTSIENLYYGDVKNNGKKTNSFLARFYDNGECLEIYYFDFYTKDIPYLISKIQ
jgi:hypothetical protein